MRLLGASRGYTLLILTALSAMNQLDRQLMNVLIEPIRIEFGLNDVQIGLLSGFTFAAVYTLLSIPAAIVSVRSSRRNLLAASAALWGTMTALCGFAQSYAHLAIARFGVGIGEAGGMPPTHAILSDLYRPGERATAMAVMSSGINIGVFFAFLFGGLIGHFYGWRTAFACAGTMTLLLALVLGITIREPQRDGGASASQRAATPTLSLLTTTLRIMANDAAIRHILIGSTLASIVSLAGLTWLPSFLIRSHGLDIASAGTFLAVVIGLGGAVGTWIGGLMSDRLRRHDIRWSLWIAALILVATKPFSFGFLLASPTVLALALFVLPGILGGVFVGPSIAVVHERVPAELRPIASAVFLLVVNFIGLGIGPLMVGAISQYVFDGHGADSLRYALVCAQFVAIWAAWHFYAAGTRLRPADGPIFAKTGAR